MWYSQSSCSSLFVCTAILCWDYQLVNYSFFNITDCTPSSLDFPSNLRLIPGNNHYYSQIHNKYITNGFICSNCTRQNFVRNTSNHCLKQITRIELRNSCELSSKQKANICQCFVANYSIQPIKDWMKVDIKPGKSHINSLRIKNINKSHSTSVYFLIGFLLLLVLNGGIIGMIFYWIKFQSIQQQTMK